MLRRLAVCIIGIVGCDANAPSGVFVCSTTSDCPHGQVCSLPSTFSQRKFCYDDPPRLPDAGEEGSEPEAGAEEEGGALAEAGAGGTCTRCGGCEETRTGLSAQHLPEPINYSDNPPMGGDHASCWAKFGVHTSAVPEARWVHNLEHGAVVFLYNCPDGCAAEVAELEALAKGRPFALVTPNSRVPTRFAVVAWGVRLLSECLDRDAFSRFYEQHFNQAGESTTAAPPGGC